MTEQTTDRSALKMAGAAKSYNPGPGQTTVFQDVSLSVAEGELVAVVGASGCGKTTFIKCIAGLTPLTGGSAEIFGERVNGPSSRLGMVFQDYGRSLLPWLKVSSNVELPLLDKGIDRETRQSRVDEALHYVGLEEHRDKRPWQLSGGMQQRVAIARALAYQPSLLLMDEPFGSLDAQTRSELQDITLQLKQTLGVTTVFITHDIDEAIYLSDRVLVLEGRPSTITDDIEVPLGQMRDQIDTKADPRFSELRQRVATRIRSAGGTNRRSTVR